MSPKDKGSPHNRCEGYLKLRRGEFDDELWCEKRPFSRRDAYLHLLEKHVRWGDFRDLGPGQFQVSYPQLAGEWGWTIPQVRHFFGLLEKSDRIELIVPHNRHNPPVYQVCQWRRYSGAEDKDESDSRNRRPNSGHISSLKPASDVARSIASSSQESTENSTHIGSPLCKEEEKSSKKTVKEKISTSRASQRESNRPLVRTSGRKTLTEDECRRIWAGIERTLRKTCGRRYMRYFEAMKIPADGVDHKVIRVECPPEAIAMVGRDDLAYAIFAAADKSGHRRGRDIEIIPGESAPWLPAPKEFHYFVCSLIGEGHSEKCEPYKAMEPRFDVCADCRARVQQTDAAVAAEAHVSSPDVGERQVKESKTKAIAAPERTPLTPDEIADLYRKFPEELSKRGYRLAPPPT